MAVIHSQNFDGVTAPAIPTGWTVTDANTRTTTTQALSSPNSLAVSGASATKNAYYSGAQDGNGGDAVTHISFRFTGAGQRVAAATCRVTSAPHTTAYNLSAISDTGFRLQRVTAGSGTTLGSIIGSGTTFANDTWYRMTLRCFDDEIKAKVTRLSDNQWLQSNGSWTGTEAWTISVTDPSPITGQGNAGIRIFQTNTFTVFVDDFLFETAAVESSNITGNTSPVAADTRTLDLGTDAPSPVWTSDDTDVMTVDSSTGVVTLQQAAGGVATISDGISSVEVEFLPRVPAWSYGTPQGEIGDGETITVAVTLTGYGDGAAVGTYPDVFPSAIAGDGVTFDGFTGTEPDYTASFTTTTATTPYTAIINGVERDITPAETTGVGLVGAGLVGANPLVSVGGLFG